MNILITGRPGVGKTGLIKEIAQILSQKAGGFYTEEIRKSGERSGFRIKTLSGKTGVLSGIDIDSPHRIGKYKVDLAEFEKVALPAIEDALAGSRVIIIDEIGPMELFSQKFKQIVLQVLDAPNPVIATIKLKGGKFIEQLKSRCDVKIFELRPDNRKEVLKDVGGHFPL